jgi:hypothetical protein
MKNIQKSKLLQRLVVVIIALVVCFVVKPILNYFEDEFYSPPVKNYVVEITDLDSDSTERIVMADLLEKIGYNSVDGNVFKMRFKNLSIGKSDFEREFKVTVYKTDGKKVVSGYISRLTKEISSEDNTFKADNYKHIGAENVEKNGQKYFYYISGECYAFERMNNYYALSETNTQILDEMIKLVRA